MVRCKFRCNQVKEQVGYVYDGRESRQAVIQEATFVAVTSGSEENKKFFAATPVGTLTIGSHVAPSFEAGKYYYLDISEAQE